MALALLLGSAACGNDAASSAVSAARRPALPAGVSAAGAPTASVSTSAPVSAVTDPTVMIPTAVSTVAAPEPTRCVGPDDMASYGVFDLESGELLWSTCSTEQIYRTVTGATAEVVVSLESKDGDRYDTVARSAADGRELWRSPTGRGLGVPPGPVGGSGVAVIDTDADAGGGTVVGVDLSGGGELWRLEPGLHTVALAEDVVVVASGASSPTVDNAPASAGLRGIDRLTGTELWRSDVRFDDESGVGVQRGAAAITGTVVAVPTGSTVTGVDVSSGGVLWTAPRLDHPTGSDGVFVGTDQSRDLRAIDAETGADLWTAAGAHVSYGDLLAVGDGVVVVSPAPGRISGLELRSGVARWEAVAPKGEPQATFGRVAVLLWEGDLGAVSTADGATMWHATDPLGSPYMSSVTANDSMLFVSVNSLPWGD